MTILYIITQADGGGAQKYVLTLARYFKGAIAAGAEAQQLFADAKDAGLDTYPLKHLKRNIHPWHDLMAVFEINRLIKKLQPDIVHLNSTKAGFLGSLAGWLAKQSISLSAGRLPAGKAGQKVIYPKIVFSAHGFRFLEPLSSPARIFYLWIEKLASFCRDYIITVSEADRQAALKHHLIDESKISVIHNGLTPIDFLPRDEAKKTLGLPPHPSPSPSGRGIKGEGEKFLLGSIANFYKTKGLDILVDAISLLDKRLLSQIHLVMIGEGKERSLIEKKILEYELGPKVTLVGNLPEAEKYLQAFDIFVLPSRKEGFPFVLLEAMQAALPIIASKVGGIPEALEDGGLQVPTEDARALADALTTLINDKDLAAQFAHRAKERSRLFTQEKMLEETKKVYGKLT